MLFSCTVNKKDKFSHPGKSKFLKMDLGLLQTQVKNDPISYKSEFLQQWDHFLTASSLLLTSDALRDGIDFIKSINFLAHCVPLYLKENDELCAFPEILIQILETSSGVLEPQLRLTIVKSLSLFRRKISNKTVLPLERLLKFFFRLLAIKDKELRTYLHDSIISDIKLENEKSNNSSLNKSIQSLVYGLIDDAESGNSEKNSIASRALRITIALFNKNIWRDARTANIIANAAIKGQTTKIIMQACEFFIRDSNGENKDGDVDSDDSNEEDVSDLKIKMKITGRSKALDAKIQRKIKKQKKKERKSTVNNPSCSFYAIELLNDPFNIVERLFGHLRKGTTNGVHISFQVKTILLNAITRIIGIHKLPFLDIFSFLHRYIQPHQHEVTKILAYSVQAIHCDLPTDCVYDLIRSVSMAFIAEHCASEVIAAGINCIREICKRYPKAMTSELLKDLAQYKSFKKDKIVMASARGLVSLYRELNPDILHRRDRGKEASMAISSSKASIPSDRLLMPSDFSASENESNDGSVASSESELEMYVNPDSLESKKKKHDYESRLSTILEGRADRPEYGSRKKKHSQKNIGKTNRLKEKQKPLMMTIHKKSMKRNAAKNARKAIKKR